MSCHVAGEGRASPQGAVCAGHVVLLVFFGPLPAVWRRGHRPGVYRLVSGLLCARARCHAELVPARHQAAWTPKVRGGCLDSDGETCSLMLPIEGGRLPSVCCGGQRTSLFKYSCTRGSGDKAQGWSARCAREERGRRGSGRVGMVINSDVVRRCMSTPELPLQWASDLGPRSQTVNGTHSRSSLLRSFATDLIFPRGWLGGREISAWLWGWHQCRGCKHGAPSSRAAAPGTSARLGPSGQRTCPRRRRQCTPSSWSPLGGRSPTHKDASPSAAEFIDLSEQQNGHTRVTNSIQARVVHLLHTGRSWESTKASW